MTTPLIRVGNLLPTYARPAITGATGPRPPSPHLASTINPSPQEHSMNKTGITNPQLVANAITEHGSAMSHRDIMAAIRLDTTATSNAIYNAKKAKLISKHGKLFDVTPSGRSAGAGAPAVAPTIKTATKKPAKKSAPTFAARLKIESTKGTNSAAPALKPSPRFIPCGAAAEFRIVHTLDGGMLVLDAGLVAAELSKNMIAAVIHARESL